MKVPTLRRRRAGLVLPVLSILLGAVWLILPTRAQDPGYPMVRAFSTTEIGVDAMSWSTVQDRDGTLYFGCNSLVGYDGERWRSTAIKNAYALRGLDFSPNGRLWVGATGEIGWFERQQGGEWSFHSLRSSLPAEYATLGEVWHVFAEGEGAVFVSENGIFRWDGKQFQCWPMRGARRLLAMRSAGTVYVHHLPTGLYAISQAGAQKIIPAEVLGDAAIFWMEARADGWLFATAKGLFTFTQGRLEPFAPTASDFLQRHALTCATRLPDGRLALGTLRGGIILVRPDGELSRILTEDDGLPTRAIFSLFVDREDRLWATSGSHICHISVGSPSVLFDRRANLPAQPCLEIVRSGGQIVLATDNGVFQLQADERHFQPLEALRERVRDMQSTTRGLIVASHTQIKLIVGAAAKALYSTFEDVFEVMPSRLWPGSVLVSVGHNIVVVDAEGQARTLARNLPDIATTMAEDPLGRIWLGTTTRGILLAEPDIKAPVEVSPASRSSGFLRHDGPGFVVATKAGAILAFTTDGGWVMGTGSGIFEPIANYPPRRFVVASDCDPEGNIWIVHPANEGQASSIARILVQGSHATWQPHSVEGMGLIGAPRCLLAEAGSAKSTLLWIGGTSGLLRNAVALDPIATPPRPPQLHAFARTAEQDTLQPIKSTLPYSTRSVLFEFATMEFARRPALRLETSVEGIDAGWVAAGPTAQRELTAVRDGTYTFRVRTVAETGLVSEATAFRFEIAPPWWRTTPALVGALIVLGTATWGIFRLRVRALRRHNAELEQKVRERTEQLAKASAAKTQFVANMSHDIRNPLNGIVGLALALENSRLDPSQQEIVATLRECTTYLSTLVDDVLDFASIEAGRIELRPGPFVPAELLRSVVATLNADAVQRGAKLVIEVASDLPPTLFADASRIQQILVNYVSNALKYAGGQIRLSAGVPSGSPGEIEFAVTDEGPGINEAEQSTLFTKFTRLPKDQAGQIKGAGLGLVSCRLLADIMNGSVGVVSRRGYGARFFLRLPLTLCAAPSTVDGVTLPQANVLLVEDTDYNAWAAAAVLAKLGLAHTRARTGSEALRLFSEKRFEVVLLDRNLPDMDGTEVARRMRELEVDVDGPRAILLAVTAYCTTEDRDCCLQAGMDAFVGKPFTPDKLRKVLIAAGQRLLSAASVHVSADAPVLAAIDLSLLGYLGDGTEQGLETQIDRFLVVLGEAETQLEQAANGHTFKERGDAAHVVLSHARLIGCVALEEASVALEQAARTTNPIAFDARLPRVRREIVALREALRHRPHAQHSA